jgi:dihydroorotate dehydrogenase (NAD+) catalytic subunit
VTNLDLSAEICGVRFPNPTVLASGILGLSSEVFKRLAEEGLGGITTKSVSLQPRPGYHNPVVVDYGPGLINAVGLSNPGVEVMVEEIRRARERLAPLGVPVIASIFANTIYDFGTLARYISEGQPDLIEANISCPNIDARYEQMFAASPYVSAQVTRRIKENTDIPLIVKLSPNVESIVEVAQAVVEAGADAISAINSLGPGMLIDIETASPVLANRIGGVSGPAIRPIAVRCVYDICNSVNVPVIGIGGVSSGRDIVEMLLVGATAVGMGSAVNYHGLGVFRKAVEELQEFMCRHDYRSLDQFRGKALPATVLRMVGEGDALPVLGRG